MLNFLYNLYTQIVYSGTFEVILKLLLAVLLGGLIGLERESQRHTAGLRTHILVCIGAALAMMTNIALGDHYPVTDVSRIGAQVNTGVGFLGAGTILISGKKVIGLTTAAGLWTAACLGLAVGAGFYTAAIFTAIIIYLVLALLPKLDDKILKLSHTLNLHIEMDDVNKFKPFLNHLKQNEIESFDTSVSNTAAIIPGGISFRISIKMPKTFTKEQVVALIENADGIYIVEEI